MSTALALDRELAPAALLARHRSLGWVVAASLLLPAVFLLLPLTSGGDRFSRLQVDGAFQRVDAQQVQAALGETVRAGFWDVDLDAARVAVEQLPWVSRARVERSWPTTLRVRVWERTAVARWSGGQALDTDARVFAPAASELPADLPLLDGVAGREREVMDAYQRLQERLRGTPFELTALKQDARGEWLAQTASGIALHLGQGAPDRHLDLITGAVSTALRSRLPEVDYVDLRYTNGFAVSWRKAAAEEPHHG